MPWEEMMFGGSQPYTCGYCGDVVTSLTGFYENCLPRHRIYICPHCEGPTTFVGDRPDSGFVAPDVLANYSDDVASLYRDACNCMAAKANIGAVLCARKLLVNIATSKGADKGASFLSSIDFLVDGGSVPADCLEQVQRLRDQGEEVDRDISESSRSDAADLLSFAKILLNSRHE
jgi:hypothetical protein